MSELTRYSINGAGLDITNYIYMYHLDQFIVLPCFSDSIQESFSIEWSQSTPLSRSAPIYSFRAAGPRTVQLSFTLHRDMMTQINKNVSNAKLEVGDDYVDTMIKSLQACVLPDYNAATSSVNPPIVALRMGDDIFIKGVINGNLGLTWKLPILSNGKYSNVDFSLGISEIDPYDARLARRNGSNRETIASTSLDYSVDLSVGAVSPRVDFGLKLPKALQNQHNYISKYRTNNSGAKTGISNVKQSISV